MLGSMAMALQVERKVQAEMASNGDIEVERDTGQE
jgi:hypothetical protein